MGDHSSCKVCAFGSKIFGHGLTSILGKTWQKITLEQIKPLLHGLDLKIVGGLQKKGYTFHDIDVVGKEPEVNILARRLFDHNINNLLHYCGAHNTHSHYLILKNGFLVTFWGNKIYFK